MTKHPASRRVHRASSDDDAFVAGVLETSAWAKTNQRLVTGGLIALVVLLAAGLYYRNYRSKHVDRAAGELTAVRQTVLEGNHQLAIKDLTAYVTKFGNTPGGDEARLMLAQVYMEQNQPAKAIETIKPIAGNGDESVSASMILAAAYEAAKDLDKAEATYIKIADDARFGFEKREALERAASIRIERGNVTGANELYHWALETLPEDSPERTVYQMRIAELGASAAKPKS